MAEFSLNCPNCGAEVTAETDWVGQEAKCPNCKKNFTIVGQEPQSPQIVLTPISIRQDDLSEKKTMQNEAEKTLVCICSVCGAEEDLPFSMQGKEYECSKCGEHFIVKEAPEKTCPCCGAKVKYRASTCQNCKTNLHIMAMIMAMKEKFKRTFSRASKFFYERFQPMKSTLKTEETFIAICPECNTEIELPISQKDKEYECIGCCENFIAKEALEKKCPHCGEIIKSKATICKFCKKKVSTAHKRRKLFGVGFINNMIQRKKRGIIIFGVFIIFFIIFLSIMPRTSWHSVSTDSTSKTSSSREIVVYSNSSPSFSATYEIIVNGAVVASSVEKSSIWKTRCSLNDSDVIYAKVMFRNGYGAVGDIMYSSKTSVGSGYQINLKVDSSLSPETFY